VRRARGIRPLNGRTHPWPSLPDTRALTTRDAGRPRPARPVEPDPRIRAATRTGSTSCPASRCWPSSSSSRWCGTST
jgi:hypothetical protein